MLSKKKKKRKLLILAVLPVVIFFLLFIPIVVGGGQLQIMIDTVGFRESGDDPLLMSNRIELHGKETLTVLVHREWEAVGITITTSTTAQSIKAVLKQRGHVDIILGVADNTQETTFSNDYEGDNGAMIQETMLLSNHLNIDTNQYYPLEDIGCWVEIIVDVLETTDVSIVLIST